MLLLKKKKQLFPEPIPQYFLCTYTVELTAKSSSARHHESCTGVNG